MEHYVSFHKVLDYLKQEQQNSPRLNDFGYGDLVYFMNDSGTTTTYPFLFVTPINITYAENTTTYSLQMIFADIVNTDLSNEKDVVSDMSLEARRFLSVVKRGFLDDKIDVVLPSQATTFFERFNDHVGGVVLNADITVFEDINACDPYPVLSPTPTPSVTPTPIPTQTVTPTPTTTPTPTPIPQFNVGAGFSDYTLGIYVDDVNDEIYVGGNFNFYKTHYQPKIVKLDSSGNVIPSFTATCNNEVYGFKDDGLGYVYIFGTFTVFNGVTARRIVRVSKTDGSLDPNWIGNNADNLVRDVLIDGTDIIIVGNFTNYGGTSKGRIAKISNTNVLDTSAFGVGFSNGEGRSILKNRNGNYVVTGNFTTYQGTTCGRIVEIDSSTYIDTGLFPSTFTDNSVQNIYQNTSNGNYYFVGNSGTLNGTNTQKINEIDESANVLQTATFGGVPFLNMWYDQPNGKLYGYDQQDLGADDFYWRWDIPTWSIDTSFYNNINNITIQAGITLSNRIIVDTDALNRVYFIGSFDGWASQAFNHIVRVNQDGSLNSTN